MCTSIEKCRLKQAGDSDRRGVRSRGAAVRPVDRQATPPLAYRRNGRTYTVAKTICNAANGMAQRAGHVRADVSASGLAWQLVHAAIGFAMIKPLEIPGHATPAFVEQAIGLLMEQLAGPAPKG